MATKGKKLSDAYIELRADDSKLSGDVKVKAARVGREFGSQLNRALAALNLDPVDVKADPKAALAAIDTSRDAASVEMRGHTERTLAQVERFRRQLGAVDDEPVKVEADTSPARRRVDQLQRQLSALGIDPPVNIDADPKAALAEIKRVDEQLRKLSGEAASVRVRVDAESARGDLARLRQQIGGVGGDSATGFAARFGAGLGPLLAEGPGLAVAGTAIGVALTPTMAAALAAGVVGGAGAGGIIGGAILASRDEWVKAAGVELVPASDARAELRRYRVTEEEIELLAQRRPDAGLVGLRRRSVVAPDHRPAAVVQGPASGGPNTTGRPGGGGRAGISRCLRVASSRPTALPVGGDGARRTAVTGRGSRAVRCSRMCRRTAGRPADPAGRSREETEEESCH